MIIANVLGLLTALSREAYGPAFAGIFGAYLIALMIQRRKIPWREGVLVALSCIGAGLYGAYLDLRLSQPVPASPRGRSKTHSPRPISLTFSSALRR